jgi:hypothetical protein
MRLVAVVAAICVVSVASGCGSSGRTTYTVGQSNWAKEWPREPASAVDVTRARRIVDRNQDVDSLLGSGATPSGSFVWLTAGRRPPVVVLRYPLSSTARVNTVVPYAVNPPDAPASGDCEQPYAAGWKRLRAQHVTRLFVAVDLDKGRVADVDTDAQREVISPVSGRAFPSCEAM